MSDILTIVTITYYVFDLIFDIATNKKETKIINIVKYILNGIQYILLFSTIYFTRTVINTKTVISPIGMLYFLVIVIPIIRIIVLPYTRRDVVVELFVMLCVVPFILDDIASFNVFEMMRGTSWSVSNYKNGSWNIKFMDVFLLIMFLIMPIVDNIYSFADKNENSIPSRVLRVFTAIQVVIIFLGNAFVLLKQLPFGKLGAYCLLMFFVYFILRCIFNISLTNKVVDNLKALGLLFIAVYLYFQVMMDIDLLTNSLVRGIGGAVGSTFITIFMQAFVGPMVTTLSTKFTTDVVLDTHAVEIPLIEAAEKRDFGRPTGSKDSYQPEGDEKKVRGRPKGSKDSYQRTRRTKKQIEEAKAMEK